MEQSQLALYGSSISLSLGPSFLKWQEARDTLTPLHHQSVVGCRPFWNYLETKTISRICPTVESSSEERLHLYCLLNVWTLSWRSRIEWLPSKALLAFLTRQLVVHPEKDGDQS